MKLLKLTQKTFGVPNWILGIGVLGVLYVLTQGFPGSNSSTSTTIRAKCSGKCSGSCNAAGFCSDSGCGNIIGCDSGGAGGGNETASQRLARDLAGIQIG